eukprot:s309_g11.t1
MTLLLLRLGPLNSDVPDGGLGGTLSSFQQDWSARWLRHKDVPLSQWRDIIQFASARLQPAQCTHICVDENRLRAEIKARKARTSKGLDGVSLTDLRSAPSNLLANMCRLYHHATMHGEWPIQLTSGKIASLAKRPDPASPADFRPITVFGLGYRLWTSIQCKSLLTELDPILPTGLFGNRRGCHPAQLWTFLLWRVEESQAVGQPASGVMADIVKAFNHLPRHVVEETLRLLGVPTPTLVAWMGAVNNMARHFQIRGSLSGPTYSCTGFAEGDGMSILAMLAINTLFHAWFEAQQVPIQPLSFVDDWQLLLKSFQHAETAIGQLQRFCDLVDLTLDHRKTFAWSLEPAGRKCLRESGVKVVTNCRTLGAHLQLSRQHTNKTLQQRVHSLSDMWDRLRLSPSPYKAKSLALITAAWPRGLHGVAATSLSSQTIGRLRSGAMRGLCADGSGANPWIHLGMIETPEHDPGFWSIVQTIRCARECGSVEWILPVLIELAQQPVWSEPHSFSCTILNRCHALGWSFMSDGLVADAFGTFCLFRAPMPEVQWRAQIAWQNVVWQAVSHRPGLRTLDCADAHSTRKFLTSLNKEDAGMMRTILNGTHFTSEAQQYWVDEVQGLCPYCQCSDSRFHRFWQCEAFSHERSSLTADQWKLIPTLPEALTSYGWILRAPCWTEWHQLMAASPTPSPVAPLMDTADTWLDLFTDGSCLWPRKKYRLAAWAVLQAQPDQVQPGPTSTRVLAVGTLPGLLQSAYRAELYAVYTALLIAHGARRPVRIWCDCQGVVDGFAKLLVRARKVRVNGRHADLWTAISELLADLDPQSVCITKVAAHQDTTTTVSGFEAWCYLHNGLADQAAQMANIRRPETFWQVHRKFVAQTEESLSLAHALHTVMLKISRKVLFHQVELRELPNENAPPDAPTPESPCPIPWQGLPNEEVQDATSVLPKQRPLETVAEYSRRLQQAVKSKLQVVQKKANTDHQKERQKERARAVKDKRRARAASKAPKADDASTKPAKFGEVVQRPPSFSKDTLKSLSKGQAVKSSAANLSDYASQVRNAYEEMKKKRREKAEAAQLAAAGKK